MDKVDLARRNRNRFTLILLLLVFVLPVVLAYLFYKNPSWQPAGGKNYGTLFKPAVTLNNFSVQTAEGEPFGLEQMRGKWSLLYLGNGRCGQACRETLYKAGAARIAQGTDAGRVNYYYVLLDDSFDGDMAALKRDYPQLIVLRTDPAQRAALISQFSLGPKHTPGADERLYLADPLGNLILHYPAGFRDLWLMEDLKHLLKWSQLG